MYNGLDRPINATIAASAPDVYISAPSCYVAPNNICDIWVTYSPSGAISATGYFGEVDFEGGITSLDIPLTGSWVCDTENGGDGKMIESSPGSGYYSCQICGPANDQGLLFWLESPKDVWNCINSIN